jgi:hypothetical protein
MYEVCTTAVKPVISHTKGEGQIGNIWGQGADENIWTWERQEDRAGWRDPHEERHNL